MMPATQSKIIDSEQLSSMFVKSGLSFAMNTLAVIANPSIPKMHFENPFQGYPTSAVQKIKKLSEKPVTVHNIAKLCVIDGKNREITKKLVQPVPPPPLLDPWEFQWENDKKK